MTFKNIIQIFAFANKLEGSIENAKDIVSVVQLRKVVKKFKTLAEQLEEEIEDLRLDYCYKENDRIVRDSVGNYQWTAEGEKAFRRAYKSLLEKEIIAPQFEKLNWQELEQVVPQGFLIADLENLEETLSEFYNLI
jgi:hypothetical protein